MSGFLLDTNLLSELVKRKSMRNRGVLDWVGRVEESLMFISVLTLGEIRKGVELAPPQQRGLLETWLESELRSRFAGRILGVDEAIADRWGAIAATARLRGEVVPVIDGLLAATALEHGLTVVTRNIRHFAAAGARTTNPWT